MLHQVKITDQMRKNAQSEYLGVLNKSITSGRGNVVGFLGEEIVSKFLGVPRDNTFDYDITMNSVTFDVKTKKCTSKPKDFYECSVAAANTKQNCDFYIFTRILDDYSKGWICGFISKEGYFQNAVFHEKGTTDGPFVFKSDCYNLPISKLDDIGVLIGN